MKHRRYSAACSLFIIYRNGSNFLLGYGCFFSITGSAELPIHAFEFISHVKKEIPDHLQTQATKFSAVPSITNDKDFYELPSFRCVATFLLYSFVDFCVGGLAVFFFHALTEVFA